MNDSVSKCIVPLRLTVIVKVSMCLPGGIQSDGFQCSGKGKCITRASEVRKKIVIAEGMWRKGGGISISQS